MIDTAQNPPTVIWTNDKFAILSGNVIFTIEENTFYDQTFSIRTGEYFIVDHRNIRGQANLGKVKALKLQEIDERTKIEASFQINCASDNYGALIDQPKKSFEVFATASPTCSGLMTQIFLNRFLIFLIYLEMSYFWHHKKGGDINVIMPSLPKGDYKVLLRSASYGQVRNLYGIRYKMAVENISPLSIGVGGGVILTIEGTGFSEDIKATLCGENLKFIDFNAAESHDGMEKLLFETKPINLDICSNFELDVGEIEPNNRKRRSVKSLSKVDKRIINFEENLWSMIIFLKFLIFTLTNYVQD